MPDAAAPSRLCFRFGPASAVTDEIAAHPERALLVVRYGGGVGAEALPVPVLEVPNRRLDAGPGVEVWESSGAVERGSSGAVAWAKDGALLAGSVRCPLGGALEAETHDHFGELIDLLGAHGYPHLLRVWNYLPGINAKQRGVERYRLFNAGRARAFEERFGAESAIVRYSASSAVGAPGTELVTAFLAARLPGRHFENPRQVPAFHYPPLYGAKSPSFCRGTLAPAEAGGHFFLSGTASIVGHRSRWMGDVAAQLEETLANVEALSAEAGHQNGASIGALSDFALVKTYLRDAEDLSLVQAALARLGVSPARSLLLEADICRGELDLEIEGVAAPG